MLFVAPFSFNEVRSSVHLRSAYFVETEIFLVKILYIIYYIIKVELRNRDCA